MFETSGFQKCKTVWLWVRSPLEDIKYLNLYFHFFALGDKAKRGVEFCHLTRNASRIRKRNVLTLGSFCLPCCVPAHSSVKLIYLFIYLNSNKYIIRTAVFFTSFNTEENNLCSKVLCFVYNSLLEAIVME